jgi:hypothetical protein
LAFSKADQCSFSNDFSGFKIKSSSPDFKYGSGNELSAVPIIFTRQSKNFITREISGFLSAKHKQKINHSANIKNVENNFLPIVRMREDQYGKDRRCDRRGVQGGKAPGTHPGQLLSPLRVTWS